MRIPLTFVASMILSVSTCAVAQTTLPAGFEKELDSIYATSAAKIELNTRTDFARRVEAVLHNEARFLIPQLKPWQKDPTALLLFKGLSTEQDIRSDAHLAYGLATIARAMPEDPSTAEDRKDAIAVLRFLLQTHGAGGMTCNDGKQWHNQWQSAFWAHSAGKAAWLLWDDLDPKMKWLAARMIADEADRFVGVTPPAQVVDDTKAEENAWDSMVISLAAAMFPHHPHHAQWQETAIRWAVSSFLTPNDVKSDQVIDGKPLREWAHEPNIHEDFSLENHDRVHPDYMANIRLNLTQELDYRWGGASPPAALRYNAQNVYAALHKLDFPDGGFIYPNGQDWHLHRADFFDIHTMMALDFNDPQAARMMHICLEEIEKMQARHADGSISAPNELLSPSAHLIQMEEVPDAYFHLRKYGDGPEPVGEDELWRELSGRHVFTFGKFALLRTPTSVATFSWGRQVMGMVLPLRKDLLLAPNERSLIGMIEMTDGKRDTPVVRKVNVIDSPDTLAVAGILDRAGGTVEQRFAFVALPDGRAIYADSLKRVSTTRPAAIDLGTLGVLNDKEWVFHDGKRTLVYKDGEKVFAAADADKGAPVALSSPWYNLDDLGIICLKSSGEQIYNVKRSPTRGRLEQLFQLNHVPTPTIIAAGTDQPFAGTILVLYPNQTPDETRKTAGQCRLEAGKDALHFVIVMEDKSRIRVDLENLQLDFK